MDRRRTKPFPRMLSIVVASAALMSGCSRNRAPADTLTSTRLLKDTTIYTTTASEHGPTVFTDTALFRRFCTEADSGLTPRTAGKCTPRDQSLWRMPRDVPRRVP